MAAKKKNTVQLYQKSLDAVIEVPDKVAKLKLKFHEDEYSLVEKSSAKKES